ncbi:hypothetical protein ASZ78_016689 [Callipepla squamata]|uniref:Calponin-homology (CH) domain-containing protein n=1 Tax=Callipepla squamata TaxID=9009 RepID=A0A226NLM0_CALSU|nr:hypothetical protein ASZ78_016689 [Callipepla squamata]
MAAGSFPGAAAWELSPSGGPRRRRWAVPRPEDESDEEPAVLLLSHFSRPPYLSFGSLRVGASRTRLLGIENPNAEDAEVVVERFPASARGFSLERRRFCVESQQRIFLYVTWTPLEEGKVRELVTFVINGIVKHQAVLLGVAEQPLKKKKSLWDTIKKRNVSETSASRKINKRNSKVKNVNKTFQVSQKADRLRSPLQSCENQDAVQNSTSPVKESPGGSENKLPISPIAPVLEELRTTACTPLSMRRSTTFSDIAAAVNEGLLPEMGSHNFNKLVDDHNELKSGSAYNSSGLEKPPVSNSEVILDCTLSPVCTPEHSSSVPFISTRRFLSPESFVRDNYQADGGTVEPSIPILSPDQFVKDMQLYMQLKTPKPEATLISSTTETYVVKECVPSKWKKNAGRQTKTQVHVERVLHEAFQVHSVDSQVLHCNKAKENHLSCPPVEEFQIHSAQTKQPKKRPVLSATVVKNKRGAGERKKMEMLQSKSKKCLNSAIMACENVGPVHTKADISERLPVIGPASAGNECPGDKVSSSAGSVSLCRKRKNEAYMEKIRAVGSVHVEEVERKRALTSSVDNKTHTAMRPSAFKHTARERTGQRKKPGSSLQKASKTSNRISKPVAGLAQSHLVFVKPLKTVNAAALILGEETHHKTSVPKAPTKEEVSLKAYTARRRLNKLRRDACRLFTSEAMVKAIKKLEVEIETRRLLVRRDRHLWKDVGERQKILNWLLSYNPLWLRIGLETVYGELITLESNSDFMGLAVFILNRLLWNPDIAAEYRHPTVPHLYREGHEEALSKFTLKKLLLLVCFLDRAKQSRLIGHDPCLFCKDAEFKTSKDILLAISRDFLSGEGDLSRHLGFLGLPVSHIQTPLDEFDFAVTNLAVDLQCGIRLVRAMELLTNDWNLSKQLRVPAISRLQKMHNVDIVLNVLKERGIHLKDESGASIDCRDIVDRHRERTLALLWKIVFAFQVDVLLDVEQLKEEIKFLKNAHKIKMQLGALKLFSSCCGVQEDSSGSPSPQNHSENVKLLMAWVNAVCGFYNIKVENFTVCFSDGRVLCHLIHHYHPCYMPLEAVCQRTTQTVECSRTHKVGLNCSSSSSSESDTSLNVMEGTFDQTVTASALYKELLENEKKNFQLINTAVSDLGGIPAMIHHSDMSNTIPDEKVVITYLSFLCSRLLDLRQETRAARLIQSAWRKYRLKRELKLSQKHYRAHHKQVRQRQEFLQVKKAAVCIQAAYRGYNTRKKLKLKHRAAVKIQTAFRAHAARSKYQAMIQASVVIQRWYRTCKTSNRQRLTFLMTRAAVLTLQAAFRGYQVRKQIRRQHAAATAIQSAFRKFMALKTLRLMNDAALIIQRRYRASVISRKQRQEYVELRNCVVRLQAIWRGKAVRKEIQKKHSLATIIQSYYRMHVNRLKFKKLRQSTLVIQRYFKAYCLKEKQRAHYLKTKAAVLVLQSAYRGMTVRKQLRELCRAATIIQAAFRSYLVKKNYVKLRSAAVVIQRHYRAVIHTKWQRQKYLSLKAAAVKMQAIYRGVKVRRRIHSMHQAAICIQAMFKMHRINIRYQAIRMAAIIIQRQYRAICLGRAQRKKYLELKKSAIVLQAAFRGRKVRQDLKMMHQSAALIQSYYRMHKQQRDFRNLLLATRRIQQWYRACKERNKQVHNYVTLRSAALCLQAAFRGMKTRRLLRTMNESAELIQRRFRTFLRRKHFISLRTAAIVIQRKYRATKLAKIQRQKYLSLLNAAVIIQSAYRGFVVRQKVRQMHQAAKVIQATLRMRKIYISYQALRLASVIIQQRYRAYREGKRVREMYLKLYNSVLVLQAAYRGMKTRCFLKKRHEAALTIQRNYRMYRQYRHYRRVQWATQLIQRRYRANSQRNIAVRRYSSFRKAAICIQRAFREMRVKKQHQKMHHAATVVQKNYKAFRERQRFLCLKAAALVFQRRYRALILSRHHTQEYLRLRSAAVRIQAVYRGIRVRRSIGHMHLAACTIQSAYKMHRSRRAYQKLRAAAIVIQNYYRSYLEVKNQQKKYLMIKKSVLLIQAYYRGTKERQRLKTMHASAVVIQSSYRMYIQRKYYKQLCWAVRVIQQRFRAKTATVADMENYAKIRKAIICLQSSFRAKKARQLYKASAAALCIQSFIRMRVERKRFLVKKAAAITIQSAFRGQRARSRYKSIQRSIVAIQRWYRACHRARLQKAEYSVQRQAIIIIQSAYRGMKARELARQTRAARRIQSFLQMAVQRRKFIRLRRAAITLQAYYFMHKTKSRYASCRKAAVVLQRWYRSHLIVKRQRVIYLQTLEKIIVVQAIVRRFIVKKRFQKIKESTIKIQAHFRGFTQRRRYLQCKFAALVIQQRYRACLMRNAERQRFNQKKRAAIRIQASYRGFKARQLANKVRAAQVIQAWFRGCKARKEYASIVEAVCVIKSHFRTKQQRTWRDCISTFYGYSVLSRMPLSLPYFLCPKLYVSLELKMHFLVRFLKMKLCVLTIQRRWRATLKARTVRLQFLATKNAAIKIQLAYRQYRARRLLRKKHEAACLIQTTYRCFKERRKLNQQIAAAVTIQKHLRAWREGRLQFMKYNKIRRAIIKLQAFIRGYLVRKKVGILHFKTTPDVNRKVNLSIGLYKTSYFFLILQYERTTQAVYEVDNSIDTLLDLLQMYRGKAGDKILEKGGSIFTKTCCLLAILSKDSKRALEIRSMPRVVTCIQSLYKLTARKCKMDAERMLMKQKTNTLISGTSLVPVTPLRIKTVSRYVLKS